MRTRVERRRLVGQLLREARLAAELRQVDVAARLGRPQSYVSKYESGEQSLDITEVGDVCAVLGTSLPLFAERLVRELSAKH